MKILCHKSSDGVIHETFEAFAAQEESLFIERAINDGTLNLDLFDYGSDSDRVLSLGDLSSFIAANAAPLREMLKNSAVTKRGRKPVVKAVKRPRKAKAVVISNLGVVAQ